VSFTLDDAIRNKAKEEGKSLNEVVTQTLARALDFSKDTVQYRQLDDLAGTRCGQLPWFFNTTWCFATEIVTSIICLRSRAFELLNPSFGVRKGTTTFRVFNEIPWVSKRYS
jgi:hypothetical protein